MGEEIVIPYGLKRIPTINDDDRDGPVGNVQRNPKEEFSACNRAVVKRALDELGDRCQTILEIGVYTDRGRGHKMDSSSTVTLLDKRPKGCVYVGVDKMKCTNVMKNRINAFLLQCDSSDTSRVCKFIDDNGGGSIDLLHIDGYHSVNQILRDWQYVQYLSDHGIVLIHDTNVHPGPVALLDSIDENVFELERCCTGMDDWGIALLRKKR